MNTFENPPAQESSEKRHRLELASKFGRMGWIEVEEREPGKFAVVDYEKPSGSGDEELGVVVDNNTFDAETDIQIKPTHDENFEDFNGSNMIFLGGTNHARWKDVIFDFSNWSDPVIEAPSLEAVKEALKNVVLDTFNPDDV
ncbi:MAG: hypothetical protein HY457_00045 [Parcubacteria group bacterium]|nr:hypothetical protein [Parcubacteria group bacterium]